MCKLTRTITLGFSLLPWRWRWQIPSTNQLNLVIIDFGFCVDLPIKLSDFACLMSIHKEQLVGTVMILNDLISVWRGDFLMAGVLIRSWSHSKRLVVTKMQQNSYDNKKSHQQLQQFGKKVWLQLIDQLLKDGFHFAVHFTSLFYFSETRDCLSCLNV